MRAAEVILRPLPQKRLGITKWVCASICRLSYRQGLSINWQRSKPVTMETNAALPPNVNIVESPLAVRERSIYPNLKLRVYTTGMRQNRLAKLVGIDEAYLSRIINGVRVPGRQMQEQIAQVLGCDPDWLFQQATIQVPVEMKSVASGF